MKYKNWLTEWIDTCIKPFMKERTIIKYNTLIRTKIIPVLGEYELSELKLPVLQRFISDLTRQYAPSTVESVMSVLKGSLRSAVKMGLIEREYTNEIEGPRVEEKPVESFDREEQKKIEEYIINKKENKLIGILICLYTGIRIGELFALTWDDIDFGKNLIYINKSCHDSWGKDGYKKVIEKPKTKSSKRVIPLPKQLIPFLKRLKKNSANEFVIYGIDKPITVRSYQRTFERILVRLDIPHKGFHALRHTFATRAHECGMNAKTLSEILGHKNPLLTMSRYAHSMLEYKSDMMNKIGKLLQ